MRVLCPSSEKIGATYEIRGDRELAQRVASDICIEQTVEFPADLVTQPHIRDEIFGHITGLSEIEEGLWQARIEYSAELASQEVPQLLNVVMGNTSLKTGVKLVDVELPASVLALCGGPRFGVAGLRKLLAVPERPLVASAIKPMGLSNQELAELALAMARGGIDIIKDDHGLSNQPFCRFEERVRAVTHAIRRAQDETGKRCLYAPNVAAPLTSILARAEFAAGFQAGALMIAPGLCGFDALRLLASSEGPGLPLLCHPAWLGSLTVCSSSGLSHGLAYGLLPRLLGADASIFPNFGGRFSFSEQACRDIAASCQGTPMGLTSIFPVPAGGMTVNRVPEMARFYGLDTMLLIGGDLRRHGDLEASCRSFVLAATESQT
ncbi:MAG: RuBisCO large subunit C-terminal-like domain-containing protein [Myxococcota bacterium]|jgi:ribulose-bisphosphate carboxylase large chain|nr:RuBisCO large subunit C-terminal-like domain-containing protein [Myxococcota bacterium]